VQKEAVEVAKRGSGENSGQYAQQADGLAWMYQALGRAAEAEPLLRGNLEVVRRAVGEDHAALARTCSGWRTCRAGWATTRLPSRCTARRWSCCARIRPRKTARYRGC